MTVEREIMAAIVRADMLVSTVVLILEVLLLLGAAAFLIHLICKK